MIRHFRISLAVFAAALAIEGLWLLADGSRPFLRSQETVDLDFPRGTSTQKIAATLESSGVIRSRITFLALFYLGGRQTLMAGEYSFEHPASTLDVLRKLERGEIAYKVLVIPEGFNRFDIADAVAAAGFSSREEFLRVSENHSWIADLDPHTQNLEGYLFPDTYHFPRKTGPEQIARAMVDRFRAVLSELKVPASPQPLRDVVTLASLVEEETAMPEERPRIAAVYRNRLQRGILLQCDPTVIYAALLENRFDGVIRQSNLNSASPYNTYVHRGLPPGPISNPGRASLLAALRPEPTDYLYFVASPQGGHTFSRTLSEHNQAVSLYRRSLKQ